MVGAVGDDDLGEEAVAALEAEGIDVSAVARLEGSATGVALIVVDAAGENQIAVASGANAELGGDAVEAVLRGADGGVVLLGFEVPDAPVLAGARAARAAGLEVVVNPAPARELPFALLALSPLLTPNLDEARALAGEEDPEAAARALAAKTGAPVVVTLGADGRARGRRRVGRADPRPARRGGRHDRRRRRLQRRARLRAGGRRRADRRGRLRDRGRRRVDVRRRGADGGSRPARPGSRTACPRLEIYLQDHYAGSTGGLEMAKRTAKANGGTEFGGPLTRLAGEIREDRDALKRIMARLDVSPAPVKAGLAWAAEKAGRLKPNGQLRGYSPLGRMVEIEALITGVSGKLSLWRALQQIAPSEPRLDAAQLADLAARAEDQLARLHDLRDRAAAIAFVAG